MTRELSLSNSDQAALVDDDVHEWASRYTWSLSIGKFGGYVRRNTMGANRCQQSHYLHREIMGAPDGAQVDHKNRNPLDNRRSNLRLVDRSQNQQNTRIDGRKSATG